MGHDSPPHQANKHADKALERTGGGDEHATDSLRDLSARLRTEQKKLALVQEVSRALSAGHDLDQLLTLIMEKVTLLMEADRSTLYLLSDDRKELWSKVIQGGELLEIRLNVGEGIAGWVAASGEVVNIPDAYIDKRFQPAVDLRSGYRTSSILCTPMRNSLGSIVGVAQVLNKKGGPFTGEDEELLNALSSQAAVSIENSKLYHSVVAKNVELLEAQEKLQQKTYELNVLYEIEKEMNAAHDLEEMLERILHRAMGTVGAEAGTIALREADSEELRFVTTAGPVADRLLHQTLPMGAGVLGWVAARREALLVNDPETDVRHALEFARTAGLEPRHLICAPLVAADEVLGAIELIDKAPVGDQDGTRGFDEGDLKLLTLIAGQASKAIQLARSQRERENQDRLASIGRMLAGVLHDLKTPMTIISGYAQLMAQIEDGEQREAYVEQILRQFDLMSGMTREVLQFARGESNVLVRKVYMHRFLDELVTQLNHALAGRGIELRVDARYTGVAFFDEQKILRVAHNLARNAAEAMTQGGVFTITTDSVGEDMSLEFRDDGPGIPPEMEGRLFEMFASGKEGGTGLGLAIVKKIVDEHGGEISYQSHPGAGTSFRVVLPVTRDADAPDD
ncbi:MAG TPA: GAF domain-containing protein [Kofleriaceae bacterium]|nr:GAF domain-containing protein [Kofleriaceae bacterium]